MSLYGVAVMALLTLLIDYTYKYMSAMNWTLKSEFIDHI